VDIEGPQTLSGEIKSIYSGEDDLISARALYNNKYVEFVPSAKLLIPVNQMLDLIDSSEGLLNRTLQLPCEAKFTDKQDEVDPENGVYLQDRYFVDTLRTIKLSYFFSYIAVGAKIFIENGNKFTKIPKCVIQETQELKSNSDPIPIWQEECLTYIGEDDTSYREGTKASVLYKSFWFEHTYKKKTMNTTAFGRKLTEGEYGFTNNK
jgi:phage/plasmid-associated DNA primase